MSSARKSRGESSIERGANWLADSEELQEVRAEQHALIFDGPPVEHLQRATPRRSHVAPGDAQSPPPPPPPPPPVEPSEAMINEVVEKLISSGEWCKAFDGGTGKAYFYNPSTRATTWNLRALVEREFAAYKGATSSSDAVSGSSPNAVERNLSPSREKLNKARAASRQKQQRQLSPQQRECRQRVIDLYKRHDPSKLMLVDELLQRYEGREEELLRNLRSKYPAETSSPPHRTAPPPHLRHPVSSAADDAERQLFTNESELLHVTSPRLRGLSPSGDTAAVGTHHSHPRYREGSSQPPEPQPALERHATPKAKNTPAARKVGTPQSSGTPRAVTPKRAGVAFGRAASPGASAAAKRPITPPPSAPSTTAKRAPAPQQQQQQQQQRAPISNPSSARKTVTPRAVVPKRAAGDAAPPRKVEDPNLEPPTPDASSIMPDTSTGEASERPAWQNRSPPASGRVSERLSPSNDSPRRDVRPTTPNPYSPQQGRTASSRSPRRSAAQDVEDQQLQPPLSLPNDAEAPEVKEPPPASADNSDTTPQFLDASSPVDNSSDSDRGAAVDGRELSPRALAELKAKQILLGTSRAAPGHNSGTRASGSLRGRLSTGGAAAPVPRVARLAPPPQRQHAGAAGAVATGDGGPTAAEHAAWQEELLRREREAAARRDYLVEERQRAAQRRNSDLQRRMQELQRIRDEERELRRQHLAAREEAAAKMREEQMQRAASPRLRRQASTRGEILEQRHRAALRSNSAPSRNIGGGAAPGPARVASPAAAAAHRDANAAEPTFDTSSPLFMNGWRVGRAIAETSTRDTSPTTGVRSKRLTRTEIEKSTERLQRHYSSPAAKALLAQQQQHH